LLVTRERVAGIIMERSNVEKAIAKLSGVRRVYASQGNFLLVRFDEAEDAFQRLLQAGVVVRDMRSQPRLDDALRITIGTPEQNLQVLEALAPAKVAAA
ncbi:MAG: aminotransferase class I/II-fold pyridoxal phosphate-dependent enzyme, partial [Thermomonas sp.]